MTIKALMGVEVKNAEKGQATVRFAAYDEVDKHGDVTCKGAFEDGAPVIVSSYNHTSWGSALPVGKGVLRDGGDAAYAEIQFFMNTTAGRETFEVVKSVGDLQQWSYGFDTEEADRGPFKKSEDESVEVQYLRKLKVHEISPVLLGAGNSTRTVGVKSDDSPGKLKMSDQCTQVMAEVKALADRAEEIVKLRKAEGKKGLADETLSLLALVEEQASRLKVLVEEPVTRPSDDNDLTALIMQSLKNLSV